MYLDDDDVKIEGSESDPAPIAHIEYKFKTFINYKLQLHIIIINFLKRG